MFEANPPQKAEQRILELEQELARMQQLEQLRHRIMTGAATHSGQEYFDRMVLELAEILGADFTLIGRTIDAGGRTIDAGGRKIRTLALCADHRLSENIEYDLAGTPCSDVLENAICSHPAQVAKNFPEDQLLVDMGIEGYVGVPLYDKEKKPLGIIVALYRQPVADTLAAETTLQLFANLTAAEILRLREIDRRSALEKDHQVINEQLFEKGSQLNESLKILDAIIKTLPSPVFLKNSDGIYTGCNQAFCDYLGFTREQIVGHSVFDVAPAELAAVYHRADLQLMEQHGSQTYQAQVRYADGQLREILFNKATIGDPGRKALGLVGVMTDITEIRQAEQELKHLSQLLRNIIDSMPSALITIDRDSRIGLWNRQAEELFSSTRELEVGQKIGQAFPLLTPYQKRIENALRSREIRKISNSVHMIGGVKNYFDIMIYPLSSNDEASAVIRIDNMTERVRIKEMMIQSDKMMSLGGLAAGMAHEINNPLAAIMQNLQVIQSRLLSNLPASESLAEELGLDLQTVGQFIHRREIPRMIESISEASQRAANTVQNMLNFSRQDSSELSPCDLGEIIEQTLTLARKDLASGYDFRSVQVTLELPDDLPKVAGIKTQLQQVFLSLLKNSAQAFFDRPDQTAGAKISIGSRVKSGQVIIEIADNGPGIEEQLRNRIFEPFFSTRDENIGTGLGLTVAYYIITNTHKGSLWVETAPGQGARFFIGLPICSSE